MIQDAASTLGARDITVAGRTYTITPLTAGESALAALLAEHRPGQPRRVVHLRSAAISVAIATRREGYNPKWPRAALKLGPETGLSEEIVKWAESAVEELAFSEEAMTERHLLMLWDVASGSRDMLEAALGKSSLSPNPNGT